MNATALYRFYDVNDELLYIGITSLGPNRWRDHEKYREWWSKVARVEVEHFASRVDAMAAEAAEIKAKRPPYNVHHNVERTARPAVMRGHHQGTVCQTAKGYWVFALQVDGNRINVTCETEDEARLLMAAWTYRNSRERIRRQAIEMLEAGPAWMPVPARKRKAAA